MKGPPAEGGEGTAVHSGNEQPGTTHRPQQRVTKHHLLPTRGSAGGYFCEKLRIQKLVSLKASLILEELTRRVSAQQPRNPIAST